MELPTPNPLRNGPPATAPQAQGGMRGGADLGPAPSGTQPSPMPAAQPMAEPNPTGDVLAGSPPPEPSQIGTGQLTDPNDSRYADPGWTVVIDMLLGGTLPWLMAAVDVGQGRGQEMDFDAIRMEHEQKLDALKQQHPQFVAAAEKALPFISGLGIGAIKPARTVAGTAGRGAMVGGAEGAVQGYTGADPSLSSGDTDRLASAAGGAARGAISGAAGAAAAGGVTKGLEVRQANQQAAAVKAQSDAKSMAADRDREYAAMQQRRADRQAAQEAEFEARLQREAQAKLDSLANKPTMPGPNWQAHRKDFMQDPVTTFRKQAASSPTLEAFATRVNMSPQAIANRLKRNGLPTPANEAERRLRGEIEQVFKTKKAVKEIQASSPLNKPPEQQTLEKPAAAPKGQDTRPESVLSQDYKADPEMRSALTGNMLPKGAKPAELAAPKATLRDKAAGKRESTSAAPTRDNEMATLYRTKYDIKPTPIKGWESNRKAFATDPQAFLAANPGDDIVTLAQKVNLTPKVVAQRLQKQGLDALPETLYDEVFEFDAAFKAAQKQAKKAKK